MESQLSIRLNYARGKRGRRAKSFDAGNWRRFRNFDLSLYHKKYIHGMYPPIMLLYVSTL